MEEEQEPVFEIVPGDEGESPYEAYHAVFSYILADPDVYEPLARICGADMFISDKNIEKTLINQSKKSKKFGDILDKNIVFNDGKGETHYKFYSGKTRKIYDPYVYFQIPQSHGNCFGYALYLCCQRTQPDNMHKYFPHTLCETADFITPSVAVSGTKYLKIDRNVQKAYQVYVYNDWAIVTDVVNIINKWPVLLNILNTSWNELTPNERDKWDIPLDENYTFAVFWQQFQEQLSIDQSFQLTWYTVQKWEKDNKNVPAYQRIGIEGATTEEDSSVNQMDYRLSEPCSSLNGGGGRGRCNSKKTKKKSTTNKNKNAKKTTYTHKYNTRSKSKSGKK